MNESTGTAKNVKTLVKNWMMGLDDLEASVNVFDDRLIEWLRWTLSHWNIAIDNFYGSFNDLHDIELNYATALLNLSEKQTSKEPYHFSTSKNSKEVSVKSPETQFSSYLIFEQALKRLDRFFLKSSRTHESFSVFIKNEALQRISRSKEKLSVKFQIFESQLDSLQQQVKTSLNLLETTQDHFGKNLQSYLNYNFLVSKKSFASSSSSNSSSFFFPSTSAPSAPNPQSFTYKDPYLFYADWIRHFKNYYIALSNYRKLLIETLIDWNAFEPLLLQDLLSILQEIFVLKSKHHLPQQEFIEELCTSLITFLQICHQQGPSCVTFFSQLPPSAAAIVFKDMALYDSIMKQISALHEEESSSFISPKSSIAVPTVDTETGELQLIESPFRESNNGTPFMQESLLVHGFPDAWIQDLHAYTSVGNLENIQSDFLDYYAKHLFSIFSELKQKKGASEGYNILLLEIFSFFLTQDSNLGILWENIDNDTSFTTYFPMIKSLPVPHVLKSGLVLKQSSNIFKGWRPFFICLTNTRYLHAIPLSHKDLADAGLGSDGRPLPSASKKVDPLLEATGTRTKTSTCQTFLSLKESKSIGSPDTLMQVIENKLENEALASVATYCLPLFSSLPVEITVSPVDFQFTITYSTAAVTNSSNENYFFMDGAFPPPECYGKKFSCRTLIEADMVDWTILLREMLKDSRRTKQYIHECGDLWPKSIHNVTEQAKNISKTGSELTGAVPTSTWDVPEDEFEADYNTCIPEPIGTESVDWVNEEHSFDFQFHQQLSLNEVGKEGHSINPYSSFQSKDPKNSTDSDNDDSCYYGRAPAAPFMEDPWALP